MTILLIGYGSIGARHARLLEYCGQDVVCLTANPDCPHPSFSSLAQALESAAPSHVIVSNRTIDHGTTLETLARLRFAGPILVEKPVLARPQPVPRTLGPCSVAYNLRFHPLARRLHDIVAGGPLYSATLHCGQYLPLWRPQTDYRACYSAHASQGGGVLRDLSHELDLALWLCGPVRRMAALGGRFSDLEIDSDDVFHLLAETERCPAASVTVNYLDRTPSRRVSLNGPWGSVVADFVSGELDFNGVRERFAVERDYTYQRQLEAFLGDGVGLCTLAEGLESVRCIDAATQAVQTGSWRPRDHASFLS